MHGGYDFLDTIELLKMPYGFDLVGAQRRHEAAQFARRGNDQVRVYLKARSHRDAALAGGGAREVARRARQLAKIAAK